MVILIFNDQGFGTIVNKLGSTIKKASIVFVGFDNKKRRFPKTRRTNEVGW